MSGIARRIPRFGPIPLDWRLLAIPAVALIGSYSVLHSLHLIALFVDQSVPPDWGQHRIAAETIASGQSPYFAEPWYRFRWSPVAAWVMAPVTALGPWVWLAAQFAALLTLPRALALVTLLAFPFWADIQAGNVLVFAFVAGFHALRGNPYAAAGLLVLAVLIPRPVLLPLVAYLLVVNPSWRIPFVVLALVSVGAAVVTGYHADWIEMLLVAGGEEAHRFGAQVLPGWPVIGVLLALALSWLGFPATAGLALAPYWLPYYGLLPLADAARFRPGGRGRGRGLPQSHASDK